MHRLKGLPLFWRPGAGEEDRPQTCLEEAAQQWRAGRGVGEVRDVLNCQ